MDALVSWEVLEVGMIRKLFAASSVAFLFLATARGQADPKSEAILAHRGVEEHLSWYLNGELPLDHVEITRRPGTKMPGVRPLS